MKMLELNRKPLEEIVALSNTREITGKKYSLRRNEYGSKSRFKQMINSLKKIVPDVSCIEADEEAYFKLKEKKRKGINFLVVNFSEGFRGEDREAQMPAILELLGIPYTGGTPLTKTTTLNKSRTKEILMFHGIPTPRFIVAYTVNEEIDFNLKYPLFLKPIHEGSSMGVYKNSKVTNLSELKTCLIYLLEKFHQPILVEEYLEGREFAIGLLGQEILPIVEIVYADNVDFQSENVKFGNKDHSYYKYVSPVLDIDSKLETQLIEMAQKSFNVTGCLDIARADFRCDKKNKPYVLEINAPPDTSEFRSSFDAGAKARGYSQEDICRIIVESAIKRYNKL